MTFVFKFCLVLYGVGFGSVRVLAHLLLSGSGLVWFLAKPGFLFLLGSSSFPSLVRRRQTVSMPLDSFPDTPFGVVRRTASSHARC